MSGPRIALHAPPCAGLGARLARCALMVLAAGLLAALDGAHAASVNIHAYDSAGKPMQDVAIALYPAVTAPFEQVNPADVVVAQQGMEFVPYLTVIRTGTRVSFPNRDNMEHHLKSFSATKEFEFKIYSAGTPAPVVFDRPGPVALFCLIHDWMRGFIYVVDTPFFGATDANGEVSLANLPEGKYEVRAWHPNMSTYLPPLEQPLVIGPNANAVRFDFAFQAKKRRPQHPMN